MRRGGRIKVIIVTISLDTERKRLTVSHLSKESIFYPVRIPLGWQGGKLIGAWISELVRQAAVFASVRQVLPF